MANPSWLEQYFARPDTKVSYTGPLVEGNLVAQTTTGTWIKATGANLTAYNAFPAAIVTEIIDNSQAVIQFSGTSPASITGLAAFATSELVRLNTTTATMERLTVDPVSTDWLLGRAFPSGECLLTFSGAEGGGVVAETDTAAIVLNWTESTPTSPGFAYYMSWDPYTGMFVRIRNAGGANDGEVAISHDYGESFTNIHPASTLTYCNSIGFDNAGNCVVMGPAGSILEGPTTGTLTRRVGVLSPSTIRGYVAYDSVHSKWFVFYETGGNGFTLQSTDRITWGGNAWPINLYTGCVACLGTNGTFIIISPDVSASTAQTIRTADGGASWTSSYNCLPSPVTGAGTLRFSNLLYDPVTENWFVTTWYGTVSKVYRSTDDGLTWTVFLDLPTIAIKRIYSLGSLFLAYAQISGHPTGAWIYSENAGGTGAAWKLADFGATPVIETAVAHAPTMIDNALHTYGGFAFLSSTEKLWRSLRSGPAGRVVP